MGLKHLLNKVNYREVIFHIILLSMVFIFYAHDHHKYKTEIQFTASKISFFLNYAVAAYIINYVLLPKFLYRKRYILFVLQCIILIALVIAVEELVLEQIYYPTTRGTSFPGVFINLTDAMPTITILAGFKFAWDAIVKQRELEQLETIAKDSELLYLKSQINPHFLFNNLNNLYAHAIEKSSKTPEIILELSGVLRYMLYECQEKYVPLEKELIQLENFINLSKLQLEDRGTVTFTSNKSEKDYKIAPLILTVFIENAFKHSLSSQSNRIKIGIGIHVSDSGLLTFQCKNTFSEQTNTDNLSKGIGLENVKQRLNILYPDTHSLEINTNEQLYNVRLTMNLN